MPWLFAGRSLGTCLAVVLVIAMAGQLSVAAAEPQPVVTIRAAGRGSPYLFLRDGRKVATSYIGSSLQAQLLRNSQVRPLSLASADFDEDGMPDLASGYAASDGTGLVTIHRGNVDALWPYGKAIRNGEPPAFLPNARVFALPEAPDFLGVGDFDADGHWDIVAAHLGSKSLYFLRGDGHGGFGEAERIDLPGAVTALTTGEINRVDGLTDIAVGVTAGNGSQVLVFESPAGALRGEPEIFPMPAAVTALAMMPLDDDPWNDLAVGAGNRLIAIHGRDRKLSQLKAVRDGVAAATITSQTLPFTVRSLAAGHFTSTIMDLAALSDDGRVHFLERPDADYQAARAELPVSMGWNGRIIATRRGTRDARSMPRKPETGALALRDEIAMPLLDRAARLVTAHTSITAADDVIVTDEAASQLHVLSRTAGARTMHVAATFDAIGAPAAVLPMRMAPSALHGLVVLHTGQTEPSTALPATPNTFTVTTTVDPGPNSPTDPTTTNGPGSLRWALTQAIEATGASTIDFKIPTSDRNYNPTTGVFTFDPAPTTGCQTSILEPCLLFLGLPAGLIIDGYSQSGASANTLANGDNAVLKLVLNGTLGSTQDVDGFDLPNGANTIRGLVINGFNGATSGLATTGGFGVDMPGGNNVFEGNFVGVDSTGTQAVPNSAGVGVYGGPNTIGGTVPQARNLLSGNSNLDFGSAFPGDPNTLFVQGNYIGTDRSGTVQVGGNDAGVLVNGKNLTVGGTTAGAANLLSGNLNGISISDPQGNPFTADGNIVQGNLVGTDLTGKLAVPNGSGVDILGGTGNLIGGTSPAARNVISGNGGDAVQVYNETESATVQGNYIGVDISGAKALVNLGNGINHSQISGATNAIGTLIGGESAGAGNVISANAGWGFLGGGTAQADIFPFAATLLGNRIGTDSSGANSMSNVSGGIELIEGGSNYTIGGADTPTGNIIAFNGGPGVRIDPAVDTNLVIPVGFNSVIGNSVFSNSAAGVWVHTGIDNQVSENSIYSNGGLGIDIDALGHLVNNSCPPATTGGDMLQNAPVLTAGSGPTLVSATATDPNGNTSEFSNCVAMSSAGSVLNLAGSLNGQKNTTYSIEFFQNAACDPSGFGQGKTFLTRINVTTNASCAATINTSGNVTQADLGVSLTFDHTKFSSNVHFDAPFTYQAVVTNNGLGSAANVMLTDTLPASLILVSTSPTQGSCSNNGNAITCSLGTLASGATAVVSIGVTINGANTISDTANVTTTTTDPTPANNTSTLSLSSTYQYTSIDHFSPAAGAAGAGALPLTIYGVTFYAGVTTVTANNTPLTFTLAGTQTCEMDFVSYTCQIMKVTLPATLTASPGTVTITVSNPSPGGTTSTKTFTIFPNPGTVTHFQLSCLPNPAMQTTPYSLTVTALDANGNAVPAYRGTITLGDTFQDETFSGATGSNPATYQFTAADNGSHTFTTSFSYVESEIITVTDEGTPSIMGTETLNIGPLLGAPAKILAFTTPDPIPIGFPLPQPVTAEVLDSSNNPLPGLTVTFTIVPGSNGASGTFAGGLTTVQAVTDGNGDASVPVTANNIAGGFQITAKVNSLTATFGLGNLSTVPAHLTVVNNPNQKTGPINTAFNSGLNVLVTDANNNPVLEVPVTYTAVAAGNGASVNLAGTTAVTAGNNAFLVPAGQAGLDPIGVANGIAGSYVVRASIGGLSVNFNFTNTPTPSTVAGVAATGTPQSAPVHSQFVIPLRAMPTVQADGNGNCIAQVPITFTAPASGPSATLSAVTVNSDAVTCIAQVTATANGIVGTYNVTASAPNGPSATFTLTNTSGTTGLLATGGTPQSAAIDTQFAVPLQATLLDSNGHPLTCQIINFSVPGFGASAQLSESTAATNASGVAQITATADNTVGSYVVTASNGGLSTLFALTNLAGPPASVTATGGASQSTVVTTAFASPLQVTVKDAKGDLLQGVTVDFSAPTTGASATFSASSAVTNALGVASITATANGSLGTYNVTASVGSLTATFALTNTAFSPCDVNQDGKTNVLDVQKMIDEALGTAKGSNDLNTDRVVNAVDIQIVVNAALNRGCSAS